VLGRSRCGLSHVGRMRCLGTQADMIGAYTEGSMADNRTTSTGRPTNEDESVLGSLSATRPERFGRARREVPVAAVQARGPRPAKPKPARAKAAQPSRAKAARAKPAAAKK